MDFILGCEESGKVRDALIRHGHNAISCDILPSRRPGPHYQGRLEDFINTRKWDAGIFFPPCTHLAVSGAKHFKEKRADGRQQEAIDFFMFIANLPFPKSIENPVGIMSTEWRKPDQIIQPWMFGDPFTKTTCLWLDRLQPLMATNIVDKGRRHITKSGKSLPEWYNLPPGALRARIRSETFDGIAEAMAEQWGREQSKTTLF